MTFNPMTLSYGGHLIRQKGAFIQIVGCCAGHELKMYRYMNKKQMRCFVFPQFF